MDPSELARELAKPSLPGVIPPAWDGRSIGSILPSILQALGASAQGLLPPLRDAPAALWEGVERVALLTLDGWGWAQLQRHIEANPQGGWARLAKRGTLSPLTSVAPSTTVAALGTLNTGLAPAQHGLLGYHLWLQEFGCIANMVHFAPAVGGRSLDYHVLPEEFVSAPTAAQLLEPAGAWHLNVTRREFLGSALTRMLYKGGKAVGVATLGELLVEMRHGLQAMNGSKGLVQGYWPSVDTVAHARGPTSAHHDAEMALLGGAILRELVEKSRDPSTLLLITADHGLVTVPNEGMVQLREHPDIADALLMPTWGDTRWTFLQPREGMRDHVRRRVLEAMGQGGTVLDRDELLRLQLLGPGPLSATASRRIGDLVALAPPGKGIGWPFHLEKPGEAQREEMFAGRHGGASAEEMLVPLLAVRL